MKKIILPFFILILVSLLSFIIFCHPQAVTFKTVAEGHFSISLPSYLTKADSLDPTALVQYKNEKDKLFVLVYQERDTSNVPIEMIFKKFSDDFILKIEHGNVVKYYLTKIGLQNAVVGNIRGSVNETAVYYRVAFIRSASGYYKIIIGVESDMESSYDEDMDTMIRSFKSI